MLRSYENYYFKELVELHNTLLKDVHDELNLLIRNADLETDEFVQKEVNVKNLYSIISKLLNDEEYYKKMKLEMVSVKEVFADQNNVINNAAKLINK